MALPTPEDKATIGAPSEITERVASVTPAPTAKTALPRDPIAPPTSILPSKFDLLEPPFPLNHARILHENILQTYNSLTPSKGLESGVNALVPNTASAWAFTQTGGATSYAVNFGSTVKTFDTICVGAHNLGTLGATVRVIYTSITGGSVLFDQVDVDTNAPIMLHRQDSVECTGITFQIIGGNGVIEIGYFAAGVALQMQRPFFQGHTPITDSDSTTYYRAKTESGNIIGRTIRSLGYETQYDWKNLDDAWYRAYIPAFKQYAKLNPIFIAWNLQEYPNDVGFGFVRDDISANYSGPRKLRSMNFTLLGY